MDGNGKVIADYWLCSLNHGPLPTRSQPGFPSASGHAHTARHNRTHTCSWSLVQRVTSLIQSVNICLYLISNIFLTFKKTMFKLHKLPLLCDLFCNTAQQHYVAAHWTFSFDVGPFLAGGHYCITC